MKILITGAWDYSIAHLTQITVLGHDVVFLKNEMDNPPCDDFEGIICNGFFLYHSIQNYPNLQYIQITSAGYDRIPMEYIKGKGIVVHNARDVYSIPMAEYSVLKALEFYKDTKGFYSKQNKHQWEKNRNLMELFGKTICIIGCGSVGTECGKRFKAFGCRVIGVDPYIVDWIDGIVPINEGISVSDIIILTCPLTNETKGLINKHTVEMMKSGSLLINISRGAVIDDEALFIREDVQFALDVFCEEPLYEANPLWDKKNISITPHNSFVGTGNSARLADVIINNLKHLSI